MPKEPTNVRKSGSIYSRPIPIVPGGSYANVLGQLSQNEKAKPKWAQPEFPISSTEKPCIKFQNVDMLKAGNSVLAHVVGFEPYLHYLAPKGLSDGDLGPLTAHLNALIPSSESTGLGNGPVARIELENSSLKIYPRDSTCVKRIQDITDFHLQKVYLSKPSLLGKSQDVELHLPVYARYRSFTDVVDKAARRQIRGDHGRWKDSYCQLEVSVHVDDLQIYEISDNQKSAPLRILSFDIETEIYDVERFPSADIEPVIQIGNMVSTNGHTDKPFLRTIFTLKSCFPISGAEVKSFDRKEDMLIAWRDFVLEVDPDIVTGFRINRFDIPFLLKRATNLKLPDFAFLGRLKDIPQQMPTRITSNDSDFEFECPGYEGRLLLDISYHTQKYCGDDFKGRGKGTLNAVSIQYLQEKKEDLHFSKIPLLQRGNADDRRKLAVYCLKDVHLPLRLFTAMKCLEKEVEVARQANVPVSSVRRRRIGDLGLGGYRA